MSEAVQVRVRLASEIAARFLALLPAEREAVVVRGLDGIPSALTPPSLLSRCEAEALDSAITMLRRGAAGGGVVGFRAEQAYLHEYSDFAEDLVGLRAKLGGAL